MQDRCPKNKSVQDETVLAPNGNGILPCRPSAEAFAATVSASSIRVFVSPPCLAPIIRTAISTLAICLSMPDSSLLSVHALPAIKTSTTGPVVTHHFQSVLGGGAIDSRRGWESYSKGSSSSIPYSVTDRMLPSLQFKMGHYRPTSQAVIATLQACARGFANRCTLPRELHYTSCTD